jgi:hypothetical protein
MTEKKITKRESFGAIVEILRADGYEEYAKVMEHEIELLNRKRSGNGKLTPAQEENERIKDKIVEIVSANGGGMTVTQIMNTDGMEGYTMNKMINLVARQLKSENRLIRYEEKGVAYFRLPKFEGEVNEVKEK